MSKPGPLGSPDRGQQQPTAGEYTVRCKACGHRARDHAKGACGAPPRAEQMRAGATVCGCTAHLVGPLGSPQR
jgi:hypothetical protein